MDCLTMLFFGGLLVLVWDTAVEAGIGCYKCKSVNGSDAACGDPFHPYNNTYYHRLCNETLPRRRGLFPAKYCIKIKGVNVRTNSELVFRSCGNEMFDNTCGPFRLEGEDYHGCIMSCHTHACNSVPSPYLHTSFFRAWTHVAPIHVTSLLWTFYQTWELGIGKL